MSDGLWNLLQSSSPAGRTDLYLRLIYSPSWSGSAFRALETERARIDPGAVGLLESLDRDRLTLEQNARLRNLAQKLETNLPCSWELMGRDRRLALVEQFVARSSFWAFRGRSLAENFALTHWSALVTELPFIADMLRLDGAISGMSRDPNVDSPWPRFTNAEHVRETLPNGAIIERFRSPWQLLTDSSTFPTPAEAAELAARPPSAFQLVLTLERDGSLEVQCAPDASSPHFASRGG